MPQLDEIALISGVFTLLFSLYTFYYLNLIEFLPRYAETKKARIKLSKMLTDLTVLKNYSSLYQWIDKNSFKKIKKP